MDAKTCEICGKGWESKGHRGHSAFWEKLQKRYGKYYVCTEDQIQEYERKWKAVRLSKHHANQKVLYAELLMRARFTDGLLFMGIVCGLRVPITYTPYKQFRYIAIYSNTFGFECDILKRLKEDASLQDDDLLFVEHRIHGIKLQEN